MSTHTETIEKGTSMDAEHDAAEMEPVNQEDVRPQRQRTMTDKAKQAKEDDLSKRFWRLRNQVAHVMHEYEVSLKDPCNEEVLRNIKADAEAMYAEIEATYTELRKVCTLPASDMKRAIDQLQADRDHIVGITQTRLQPRKSRSRCSSRASIHSGSSARSTLSVKMLDAAANVAARKAELRGKQEEFQAEEELAKLEEAETKRRAEVDAEMRRKRQELEKLNIEKLLSMEDAKLKVYSEELEVGNNQTCLPERGQISVHNSEAPISTHNQQPTTSNEIAKLSEALAASVRLNRLPVPEPTIFDGDSLKYRDWSLAFKTLIEDKNVGDGDKFHYLKRYVSGPAKEAISGYLLLNSDRAFVEARALLEERYGNPFVVTEAYRDKLDQWPKIPPRDGASLRRFSDFLMQCEAAMKEARGLEILNDTRENRKLLMKLPDWIITKWNRKAFEVKRSHQSYPDFKTFASFIKQEADMACDPITSLEALKNTTEQRASNYRKRPPGASTLATGTNDTASTRLKATGNSQNATEVCLFCKRNSHSITECRTFARKPAAEKEQFVKENGLCFGCLTHGHMSKKCTRRSCCEKCSKKHPTSLHKEPVAVNQPSHSNETADAGATESAVRNLKVLNLPGKAVMMSMIVPVWISSKSNPNCEYLVYALLDTQSDTTFILSETSDKLNSPHQRATLVLTTMTSTNKAIHCKKYTELVICGYNSNVRIPLPKTYTREFIPVDRSHIPTPDKASSFPHLRQMANNLVPLQDCEIGLLIGYDCPHALAPRNFVTGDNNQPFAIETDLGWSIIGQTDIREDSGDAIGLTNQTITREIPHITTSTLESRTLQYVYRTHVKEEIISPLEACKILESDFKDTETKDDQTMSYDDHKFIDQVRHGIHQQPDGHYVMPLPFKKRPKLPNNRYMALRRFENLHRRFKRDEVYFEDYQRFMNDIIDHGDAEKISSDESHSECVWYIPHHGVYHPRKPGKIRVVFDCAAKFKGQSLNDHLLKGPDLANSLIGVLLRFRHEHIAVTCDIERMFHQFKVSKEDRDYLRFLWFDEEGNIVDYRMKVHLFGAASSPACATYGLRQLAADFEDDSQEASRFIRKSFYVDDGLKSFKDSNQAINLVKEAREMCEKGNLRLHKFVSNERQVLDSIPKSEHAQGIKNLDLFTDNLPLESVLGLQWCVESDQFRFRITFKDMPFTRRGLLSTVASIYDPLGLLAPFVLLGKQILHEMCQEKLGWDEPLGNELRSRWERWRLETTKLQDVHIDRCYMPKNFGRVEKREIHHFSDASTQGFGQCSYLRLVNSRKQVHCTLLMGKARVAPLRVVTIPRLELQAAVLSIRMSNFLKQELDLDGVEEHFWTDSQIVLAYIRNEAKRFHVYVANRVQRIRDSTSPDQWAHVVSQDNPADHASRGTNVDSLVSSNWFAGPSFIWKEEILYENEVQNELSTEDPEIKVKVLLTKGEEGVTLLPRLDKFSNWSSAVNGIAVLQQRITAIKARQKDSTTKTSEDSRQCARTSIIKMLQRHFFSDEIESIRNGRTDPVIKKRSQLCKLDPFIGSDGILRVGGRLKRSTLQHNTKHPAILPRDSHVTRLLVKHYHEVIAHQGRSFTINCLRSNGYWILGCTKAVSSAIHNCITCRKLRGKVQCQKMADLPEERVEPSPPFSYTGFDCFGPFIVKDGRKESKRYGLIFTCLASRAIHIEMLDDMSTDSFINGLRCFIAIRGGVRQLRSDQGSNFAGARNELREEVNNLDHRRLQGFLTEHGCDFVQHVPRSSHMGGVWERQIRSVRNVLAAIAKSSNGRLDSSTLRTFFYETMTIVNSRPLSVEHLNDPLGPEPLTPNHLLMAKSEIIMSPPGNFVKEDLYARKRWRKVQYLAELFWTQWQKEYLTILQQRQKWNTTKRNFVVGDIVHLKEEDSIRCNWKLARIVEVMPSKDGLVRKVKLVLADSALDKHGKRVKHATYLDRPTHNLVLLLESN